MTEGIPKHCDVRYILGAGVGRVNNSGAGTDGRRKAPPGKPKVRKANALERSVKIEVRRNSRNGRVRGRPFQRKPAPQRKVVRVLELDPIEKCGRGTTVQRLIRVDELVDEARETHLVFLDRHGWYCEHGRTCPAVGHARKHAERGVRSPLTRSGLDEQRIG
jgi:hypothetical protein